MHRQNFCKAFKSVYTEGPQKHQALGSSDRRPRRRTGNNLFGSFEQEIYTKCTKSPYWIGFMKVVCCPNKVVPNKYTYTQCKTQEYSNKYMHPPTLGIPGSDLSLPLANLFGSISFNLPSQCSSKEGSNSNHCNWNLKVKQFVPSSARLEVSQAMKMVKQKYQSEDFVQCQLLLRGGLSAPAE